MPYEEDSQDAGSYQDAGEAEQAIQMGDKRCDMSADSAEADIRRSIVDLALSFSGNDKAHYRGEPQATCPTEERQRRRR